MISVPGSRHKRLVFLSWLLVAIFYFGLSFDYIRIGMNDRSFDEYLRYVVQRSGAENRPATEVRQLLLIRATELDLPIVGNQIAIRGSGQTLRVAVAYEAEVNLPVFQHLFYVKQFEHEVQFKRKN